MHPTSRFPLGRLVATPGALHAFTLAQDHPMPYLSRHVKGDWGCVSARDAVANEIALATDARLLSSYLLRSGVKIWIITEADRSATTILLPEEY